MEANPSAHCPAFPWPLYFNGEPMPRFANSWYIGPLLYRAEIFMRGWDESARFETVARIAGDMNHLGVVESAAPEVFRLCCLTLGYLLLRDEDALLDELVACESEYRGTALDIYTGLRDGLFAMHQRCLEDGIAFWIGGGEAERDFLREYIRRNRLPQTDPNWLEAPHLKRSRFEAESRASRVRRDLLSLIEHRQVPKEVRGLIHRIPRIP